ncbi:MAG: ABC transporter permease [Bacteroidota bacterium]
MLKNWLKIYLHHVKNNKFFTALNILGLALGIAGLVFAILYWNDEHSYNASNPGKNNTFFIVSDLGEDKVWGATTAALGPVIPQQLPQITEHCYMESFYNSNIIKSNGKKVMAEKVIDAQANFFSFFPSTFIKGNAKTALSPTTVALSEDLAQKLFGDTDALGKQLEYNDKSYTVNGVYRLEGKSSYMPDIVINQVDWKLAEDAGRWGNFRFAFFIKLKNPDDASLVTKKIEGLYFENDTKKHAMASGMSPEEYVKRFGATKVYLEPLKSIRLHTRAGDVPEGKGNYQLLLIMFGLSVLILIMSVANYVNLATANAIKRAKEVGVRKILGASKGNIIRQFIFETVLTTLFAILLSLVIVEVSLPYYNTFLGKSLTMDNSLFYIQLIGIFAIMVVLAGVLPAAYVSKFEAVMVLKGNFGRSKKGIWLRNAMLVGQFAIASFFIIGSYIVYSQVNYLVTKDPGFKADQILSVHYRNPYDWKVPGFKKMVSNRYDHIKERLYSIKGVETVAATTAGIGDESDFYTSFGFNGNSYSLRNMAIDFNMLEMLHISIKEGRGISPKYAQDTVSSIMLNEAAVKLMGIKGNPVGAIVNFDEGKNFEVVGVAKDFHLKGPQEKILPMIIYHYKNLDWMLQNAHHIYVKVNPQYMQGAIAGIEKLWHEEIDPDFPVAYDFVDKDFARTYQNYVHQRNLFSMLNIVVIVIALFGLFSLASFSIQRRMKEIAIRKTLGAETGTLLKELSKQYIIFCVIGFAVSALPAWILLDKWLENFAYRIQVSALPFVIGFIVLMALTLLVVIGKAYRATQVNVLTYLKYE